MGDDVNPTTGAIQDNMKTRQSRREEVEFDRKAEAMLAGHRQAPSGRNVFAFKMRELDNKTYAKGYDQIEWDTPPPGADIE